MSEPNSSSHERELREGKPVGRKRRWLLRAVYLLAGLLGLLVVVVVLMPVISPFFRRLVEARIKAMTGRETSVEGLSLNFLSTTASVGKLLIKEEDGSQDFLRVEQVEADFQLLPLLGNAVRMPEVTVGLVKARVSVDESGRANYQSILDRLGKKKEPTEEEPGFRDVRANVRVQKAEFDYENRQSGIILNLKDAALESKVKGMDDITYSASGAQFDFDAGERDFTGSFACDLEGEASVNQQAKGVDLASKATVTLSNLGLQRTAGPVLQDQRVEFTHELSMESGKGLSIKDVTVDSDLFSVDISDVRLPDPAQIGQTLIAAMTAKTPRQAREVLSKLNFEGWQGGMVAQTDLGKVRKTMGDGLAALAGDRVNDFDGTVRLSAEFQGDAKDRLQVQQDVRAEGLSVAGKLKRAEGEAKDYRVELASVVQQLTTTLNARELKCTGSNTLRATAPLGENEPTELVSGNQKWNLGWRSSSESTALHLETVEHETVADLTAIGKLVQPFLPQGTAFEGRLEARDRLWSTDEAELAEEGSSDLALRLISPDLDRPLPLRVTSERRLEVATDPLRVIVEKLDLHSQGSDLVHADVSGEFGVRVEEPAKLNIDLQSNLAELEPILRAIGEEASLTGQLTQNLELVSSAGKAQVSGGGGLEGFSYRPGPGDAEPVELDSIRWKDDVTVRLDNGFPVRVELGGSDGRMLGLQVPGMSVNLAGSIEDISGKPPFCRFTGVTMKAEGDLAKLAAPLRGLMETMGVRPGETVPLTNVVEVEGVGDNLSVSNSFRLGGQLRVGAGPEKTGFVWDRPVSSALRLRVEGIPDFLRAPLDNSVTVGVVNAKGNPPLLQVAGQQGPLMELRAEGSVTLTGNGLQTDSFGLSGEVQGEEVLAVVPADYLTGLGLTPDRLKVGGRCDLSAGVNGKFPGGLKSSLDFDAQPLSVRWMGAGGKPLIDKGAEVPVSLGADVNVTSGEGGVVLQVNPLRLRCADLEGSGRGAVGPGLKLGGLGEKRGAELSVKADGFAALQRMLPVLDDLRPQQPTFKLDVSNAMYSAADNTLQANATARLGLTSMSVPRLVEVLEERLALEQSATREPAEKPGEPAPPLSLSPEFRQMLKGVRADAQVNVQTVDMGRDDRLENLNLTVALNQEEANNRLDVKAWAAVNPHKQTKGKFEVTSEGRLDKESPVFSADYEIADLPVPPGLFRLAKKQASARFSLLESMNFAAPEGLYFGARGSSEWQGVQWQTLKRSLTSNQPIALSLPPGAFDLEVSLDRLVGSETVQNLLGNRLEGLRNTLKQAQGRKQEVLSRLQQVQGALDSLQKAINNLDSQRDRVQQTIENLKPLAAFSESTQEKLEELQGKVDKYYSELQEKKEQATEKRETTSRLQQELSKTREKLEGLREKIENARESAFGLKQVFDFSFDGVEVRMSLQNDSPWPGLDAQQGLLDYATSRLYLDQVSFTPEKEKFPQFSGWLDLAGPYRVQVMPPEPVMTKIEEKAPPLAAALRRSGGLVITPEGVQPLQISPFGKSEQ